MNKDVLFKSQIMDLRNRGIKYDINNINKLKRVGIISIKSYARPFLCNKIYKNLSFKKLLLLIHEDHYFRSHVLDALKEIEHDIDTYIANIIMNRYGRFSYLDVTCWTNINLFKSKRKLIRFQRKMKSKIMRECKNSSHRPTKNEINGDGYPSISLAAYNFEFGDMVIFIRYLSNDIKKIFTDYYHCDYEDFISWLECLRNIRNLCSHKGVLIDFDIKDLDLKRNLKLKTWPQPPKMFNNLIYSKNEYNITSVLFMIKYLMLTVNPEYDFSPIKRAFHKLIDIKSLYVDDKNDIVHKLGLVNLKSLDGLLMNNTQFVGSISNNLVYSKNNPYITNKKFLYTKYLIKYLKYSAFIHHQNLSYISSHLFSKNGKPYDRFYIHSVIKTDSVHTINKLLIKLSKILGTPLDIFQSVLFNGNYNRVRSIKDKYISQQLALYNPQSTYHHNYIWAICTKRNLPPKTIAQKLNKLTDGKNISTEDVRLCLESDKRPKLMTIIRMAYILNIKSYDLAKHFNYKKASIIHKLNIIHEYNRNDPKYSVNIFIINFMKKHNITQQELAYRLGSKYKQTMVSGWKYGQLPSLDNLINLSKIFNIDAIILLQKHPYYKDIQKGSPAYKLLILCEKECIPINEKGFKIHFGKLKQDCKNLLELRNKNSYVDIFVANKLISRFHLEKHYFNKTCNKRFEKYKKRHQDKNNSDIGYRIEYIRTLNHYTFKYISDKLGLSKQRIQQLTLENGSNIKSGTLKGLLSLAKSNKQKKYLKGNINISQQLDLF